MSRRGVGASADSSTSRVATASVFVARQPEGVRVKSHWYCGVDGQQYGPFTWEQLRAMAAEGRIVTDSFVRRDVDQQWFQAAQVPGLLP